MSDRLYGPKLKIKWAHQHIGEIAESITRYIQTEPAIFFKKLDAETSEEVTYARLTRRLPEDVVMKTSYVVHNLRAALDQTAFALAVDNGAEGRVLRDVYFPIANSADDFKGPGCQRKIAMLSTEAQRFIEKYQPYKGVNDDLWTLNELDVLDKHKVLIDVGSEGALRNFSESSVHPITVKAVGWKTFDEDIELWRHPAGTEQQPKAEFAIIISFRDVFFEGKRESIPAALHRIAKVVEGFVTQAGVRFFEV